MVAPDVWLSNYTLLPLTDQQETTNIVTYACLTAASSLLPVVRAYLFFQVSIRCSEQLHDKMVNSVLQAPVLFFDTNPAGRILNRFSEDIGWLDELLPKVFHTAIQFILLLGIASAGGVQLLRKILPWDLTRVEEVRIYLSQSSVFALL